MLKRTMLIAVLALVASTAAEAQALHCIRSRVSLDCVWYNPNPPPRELSAQERDESAERDRMWEARCEPKIVYGADGIGRYTYNGKPGCASGQHTD